MWKNDRKGKRRVEMNSKRKKRTDTIVNHQEKNKNS